MVRLKILRCSVAAFFVLLLFGAGTLYYRLHRDIEIDALIKSLASSNSGTREQAAEVLCRLGRSATSRLVDNIGGLPETGQIEAMSVIVVNGQQGDMREALETVLRSRSDWSPTSVKRWIHLADTLAASGVAAPIELVAPWFAKEEPICRLLGVILISCCRDETAFRQLLDLTNDDDARVRARAIGACAKTAKSAEDWQTFVRTISARLHDPDPGDDDFSVIVAALAVAPRSASREVLRAMLVSESLSKPRLVRVAQAYLMQSGRPASEWVAMDNDSVVRAALEAK